MPTQSQQIPNSPLNGQELKTVTVSKVDAVMNEIREQVIDRLTNAMERSGVFVPTYAHPRVRFSLSVKFQWANQYLPKTEISVMAGEGVPSEIADAESQIVIGTEQTHTIENPNLERLDAGIPFTRTDVQKAKPGEVFAKVSQVEIPVDTADYANAPRTQPVVEDTSAELATALKVPPANNLRKRK